MSQMRTLSLLILWVLLTSACGFKGPLYLPDPANEQQNKKN